MATLHLAPSHVAHSLRRTLLSAEISTAGGGQSRWRRDGKELFYLAGNAMMAVEVNGEETAFRVGAARRLFDVRPRTWLYKLRNGLSLGAGHVYDVAADGQRVLVNVAVDDDTTPPPMSAITNWTATLRGRPPVGPVVRSIAGVSEPDYAGAQL
jgi:hypothetical protein